MANVKRQDTLPLIHDKHGWPWSDEVEHTSYEDRVYPKITIVTPSYNQGVYIEETIRSVLQQNYPNLEYIIIDGGSTDNTVEIIKKYEPWITYWVSEKDNGQSHAINKGLRQATGEIFNWLNSDDYYEKDALRTIAEKFEDASVNVVGGKSLLFNSQGVVQISTGSDIYPGNLYKTIGWARIDQPCTFFRREVLGKIGNIEESLHYTMDRELWIRYLLTFGIENIVKTDKIIVNFRLHEASKTVSLAEKFNKESDRLFYTLLKTASESYYKEVILQLGENQLEDNTVFPVYSPDTLKNVNTKAIFSYYLLLRGMEAYENGNKRKCILLLNLIEGKLLSVKDRKLVWMTKLKAIIIPYYIKRKIRKLRIGN